MGQLAAGSVLLALLIVALALGMPAPSSLPPAVGSLLLLASIAALLAACVLAVPHLVGARRAFFLGLAFSAFCSLLAQLHSTVRYVLLGEVPVFPSPGLLLLVFGAHPCLIVGYAAALGWSRRGWHRTEGHVAAVLDALLLVTAAALVGIQLTYLADWPLGALTTADKAIALLWRCLPITEVVLLALLLASRGERLGPRTVVGLVVGTLSFAVANIFHGRLAIVEQAAAVTSNQVLWALATLGFALAVGARPPPPRGEADEPAVTLGSSWLRPYFLVAAILIAAFSTLVIGFREERSPELAVAVAMFGALLAVRGGHALVRQQRNSERLANSAAAERALSVTLEQRVSERTRELAEAQRVLQRMWALGQHVTQELQPRRVVERYMEAVSDIAKVEGAVLALRVDDRTLRLTSALGLAAEMAGQWLPIEGEGAALGSVVRQGRTWWVNDLHEPSSRGLLDERLAEHARGVAVVPVHRRGQCIGALALLTRRPRVWRADELSRIEAMADLLSVALANAESMDELRKAEWRFRTLFRAAPDMVLTVLYPCGSIVEANDCARDVLGMDANEIAGRRLAEFVVPEDRPALERALRAAPAAASATTPATPAERLEVRIVREGGVRHVAIALRRLAETEPPTVLLIARDMTTEREMRLRLVETERLAAVGELVARVAHEVNNPLSSISAFAQLLLRDGDLDGEQRESVEVIHTETLRAAQVVKDLLAFARRSEPRREAVDLNQVVERTIRLRGYQLSTSGIRVELALWSELPPVLGDARQLQQVVLNLVTNAVQAMRGTEGGVLRLGTHCVAEQVVLEIADTGPGIPVEARAHVFEPFYTTKEEGEGTGLGLSVSYGIVAAHGGSLRLARTSAQGTWFEVRLPVTTESVYPEDEEETGEAPRPRRSPLAGMRVLFVDDEAALRLGMEAFGRLRGFTVVTAPDARSALAAVETTSFDAMVCDLRMQEMDGWALHDVLRQRRPGLAARTVFVTGDMVSSAARGVPGSGTRPAIVVKPFRFEHLEDAVYAVLRGQAMPVAAG